MHRVVRRLAITCVALWASAAGATAAGQSEPVRCEEAATGDEWFGPSTCALMTDADEAYAIIWKGSLTRPDVQRILLTRTDETWTLHAALFDRTSLKGKRSGNVARMIIVDANLTAADVSAIGTWLASDALAQLKKTSFYGQDASLSDGEQVAHVCLDGSSLTAIVHGTAESFSVVRHTCAGRGAIDAFGEILVRVAARADPDIKDFGQHLTIKP